MAVDYDPHDGGHYGAPGPIFRGNGSWSHRNQPIGDRGDNSKFYTLQIVLASPEYGRYLETFPSTRKATRCGCKMIADVDIRVSLAE